MFKNKTREKRQKTERKVLQNSEKKLSQEGHEFTQRKEIEWIMHQRQRVRKKMKAINDINAIKRRKMQEKIDKAQAIGRLRLEDKDFLRKRGYIKQCECKGEREYLLMRQSQCVRG